MKIMFISDVPLFYPTSGSEQVLHNQAVGLSRKGFNVHAITRSNCKSKSVFHRDVNGVKEGCYCADTKNIPKFLASLFKNPAKLYDNFIKGGDAILFIICHQPFTFLSLLLTGKLNSVPTVYVFHSPIHHEYLLSKKDKSPFLKIPLSYLKKIVEGYCLKRANKIMVLSNYMKHKAMRVHKISSQHFVVNPGGVDLNKFKPPETRNRIKTELNYSGGKVHLLTVRNLEPRMGLDNLLKGFSLLKQKDVPVQLIIGGEGPEKQKLREIIEKYGLKTDVSLTGFIPAEKLPQYYGAADFFVLPTMDLEGFGLVTPESMACGTPVLGTPVGATKEILNNFDSQFLFQDSTSESIANGIHHAIDVFLKDEKKYSMLRTRCREFVAQHYSWQRHIDNLEAIIYELSKYDKIRN